MAGPGGIAWWLVSPRWGTTSRKPLARTAELLVEELGDELLIYDQRTDQVHCLSSAAHRVWRACDGQTPVEELGPALDLDSELVAGALGELDTCDLIEGGAAGGVTRREVTTRLAKMGAAAAAAPLIYSIAAPPPALARTACGTGRFGCQGQNTVVNQNACNAAALSNCRAGSCACCYTSPMQCTGNLNWSACISACNVCNYTYVLTTCPNATCPSANKSGCST